MRRRNSRYQKTKKFAPDPLGRTAFKGLVPRSISHASGVLEHMVVSGQRLDQLAHDFYNNDRYWWRIPDANNLFLHGGDMVAAVDEKEKDIFNRTDMRGQIILIPKKEDG